MCAKILNFNQNFIGYCAYIMYYFGRERYNNCFRKCSFIFYFWPHCCICHHSGWIFFPCMIFYFAYMKFFENVFSWNRNKWSGSMNCKVINISLFLPWIWPWMKSGWLSLPDTVIVTVIVNKTTTSLIPYNHELELHADQWKLIHRMSTMDILKSWMLFITRYEEVHGKKLWLHYSNGCLVINESYQYHSHF